MLASRWRRRSHSFLVTLSVSTTPSKVFMWISFYRSHLPLSIYFLCYASWIGISIHLYLLDMLSLSLLSRNLSGWKAVLTPSSTASSAKVTTNCIESLVIIFSFGYNFEAGNIHADFSSPLSIFHLSIVFRVCKQQNRNCCGYHSLRNSEKCFYDGALLPLLDSVIGDEDNWPIDVLDGMLEKLIFSIPAVAALPIIIISVDPGAGWQPQWFHSLFARYRYARWSFLITAPY